MCKTHKKCYLPGTLISGVFVGGSKSPYSGSAFEIVTDGGMRLCVTPDHEIETDCGPIQAQNLEKGSRVLCRHAKSDDGMPVEDVCDALGRRPYVKTFSSSFAEVVSIREFAFNGYVYDVEAEDGFTLANGIVCYSCRIGASVNE